MRSPGRVTAFLLLTLLVAALAVGLNSYADKQADEIVASAPAQEAAVQAEEEAAEVDDQKARECGEQQAEYDEAWDKSVEDPDDIEAEEQLEVELTELIAACEGVE